MALIVVSDIHFSPIWDRLRVLLNDNDWVSPNERFRKFLKSLSTEDRLVINGDAIAYQDTEYSGDDERCWKLFAKEMQNCPAKVHYNIGNHEYRRWPYNFSIYGLRHVQISDEFRNAHKEEIGHCRFRWFGELNSLRTRCRNDGRPAGYPSKRFYAVKHSPKLIFLDTGPDAILFAKHTMRISSWPTVLSEVASRGIDDAQLDFLEKELSSEDEAFIFLHAPPFFSDPGRPLRKVFFDGHDRFISILRRTGGPVTLIAGHTHRPGSFLISKASGRVRRCSLATINRQLGNTSVVRLIVTLPFGALRSPNRKTGYLRYTSGRFTEIIDQQF